MTLPFLAGAAQAATCTDFKTCAAVMHELSSQHYIWSASDDVNIQAAPNVELNKENAEVVFTAMLDQVGFARAPAGDGKTFRIVRSAQRKEMELPIVEASAERAPTLPKTWDWVMMRYKTKSPELATFLERMFRLHVPRESRLQADENTGTVIVTATAPIVRQLYETLKGADKPMSAALKEKMKAQERRWQELERLRAKEGKQKD